VSFFHTVFVGDSNPNPIRLDYVRLFSLFHMPCLVGDSNPNPNPTRLDYAMYYIIKSNILPKAQIFPLFDLSSD
jgi:hypothetical protein